MVLNTSTGELMVLEGDIFNFQTNETYLESIQNKYKIEIHTTNTGSKYFTIHDLDNGNINLVFLFYNNSLEWLSISLGRKYNFPLFIITEEEKIILRKLLESIGGENLYTWGSVKFNEDNKGGFVSIIIKFK